MSTGGKRFCGSASPVDEYDITRELCAARECFLISGDEDCTVLGEEYRCGGGSVDFCLFLLRFCVLSRVGSPSFRGTLRRLACAFVALLYSSPFIRRMPHPDRVRNHADSKEDVEKSRCLLRKLVSAFDQAVDGSPGNAPAEIRGPQILGNPLDF